MTNFKARKTTYKGIEMRSRLEAGFAQWLDWWNLEWQYEPCAYASPNGQYLPDFLVTNSTLDAHVVRLLFEVKPAPFDDLELIGRQADIVWATPGAAAALVLVRPGVAPVLFPDTSLTEQERSDPIQGAWCYEYVADDDMREAPGLRFAPDESHMPWAGSYWQVRP